MPKENYEDLTIEQLDELLIESKNRYNEERQAISEIRKRKVADWHEENLKATAGLPGVVADTKPIGGDNGSRS